MEKRNYECPRVTGIFIIHPFGRDFNLYYNPNPMPRPKGQIKRLKNGVWLMRVQRLVNGTRKSVSKTFPSRAKAESARDGIFEDLAKPQSDHHTCKELSAAFLKVIEPQIREQTYQLYQRVIKKHLSIFDETDLLDLTPFVLENYFAEKQRALSPETVLKIYRLLKTMLSKARQWEWMVRNPLEDVKAPKRPKKSKEVLTPAELQMFFAACPVESQIQWIFTALTGCRAQEVFGAKWGDIDFEAQTFSIKQVLVRLKGGWKFDDPKTDSSIRTVPLSAALVAYLKKHKVRQNETRLRIGSLWHDLDLIFPTNNGKPQRMANIGTRVRKIAKGAGIVKTVTPHILRHSFITNAIDGGMDLKTVSEMVGHSRPNITLEIYRHTKFKTKQTVADVMSDLILEGKSEPSHLNDTMKITKGNK